MRKLGFIILFLFVGQTALGTSYIPATRRLHNLAQRLTGGTRTLRVRKWFPDEKQLVPIESLAVPLKHIIDDELTPEKMSELGLDTRDLSGLITALLHSGWISRAANEKGLEPLRQAIESTARMKQIDKDFEKSLYVAQSRETNTLPILEESTLKKIRQFYFQYAWAHGLELLSKRHKFYASRSELEKESIRVLAELNHQIMNDDENLKEDWQRELAFRVLMRPLFEKATFEEYSNFRTLMRHYWREQRLRIDSKPEYIFFSVITSLVYLYLGTQTGWLAMVNTVAFAPVVATTLYATHQVTEAARITPAVLSNQLGRFRKRQCENTLHGPRPK